MFLTSNQLSSLDLTKNLSVKANAGSGKTAVLVERFVRILLETDIKELNSIVGITFTEKAANELRNRIFKKLWEESREKSNHNFHLNNLMERISSLQIGTIHSFCSSILREFANEAGLDSNFNIIQGMDEVSMLDEVIEESLRIIIGLPQDEQDRIALEELIKIYGLKKLKAFLKEFMNERETVQLLSESIYCLDNETICSKWIERTADFTEMLMNRSGLIQYLSASPEIWEKKLSEYLAFYNDAKSLQERCYYFDLIYKVIFTKTSGEIKKTFLNKNTSSDETELITISSRIKKISDFHAFLDFFSALSLDSSEITYQIEITKKLLSLFHFVSERYKHQKDMNAQLDFEDLLIRTRDLLKTDTVADELRNRFKFILVDEYQDTNHLQAQILYSLINESKSNLFIVGDPKQSIYGFRNAEVEIFNETEEIITSERGGSKILLDESFRLLSSIIVFINYIYKNMPDEYNYEAIPYQELIKARNCSARGEVELMLYHADDDTPSIEEEMISRRILELKKDKQPIYDIGSDSPREIEYGDIAVLLRSRTHLDSLEKTFIKYNIPYIITSGIGYYQTQEIFDLYNYLCFLINPKDDLALAGILRSPFFYIPDSALYEISLNGSSMLSFWEKTLLFIDSKQASSELIKAVDILKENISISQRISIPNLINKIITDTDWYAVLAFQENGKQTLANLNKFLVIAREFEKKGFNTLFDFVEKLKVLVMEEDKEGQAVIDPTNQMVKIMTIHAAKGLEFPVLFLPYAHQSFKPDTEPYFNKMTGIGFAIPKRSNLDEEYDHSIISKYIKTLNRLKSDSEEKRILYVALTRAHNLLFLSGKYSAFRSGRNYLSWIKEALALDELYFDPLAGDETNPSEKIKSKEPHYPFLKSDKLVIKDLLSVSTPIDETYIRSCEDYVLNVRLSQGLQEIYDKGTTLEQNDTLPEYSIAHQRISERLTENVLSATALQTYIDCPVKYYLRYSLGYPEALAQNLSFDLFRNNNNGYSINDFEIQSVDPDTYAESDSPQLLSGTMRGKILHSIFENIDMIISGKVKADAIINDILQEYYFAFEKISANERSVLKNIVSGYLVSPICKKISSYEISYNEFSLSADFEGDLLSGTIDRLCIEGDKILIVDYKTNRISSGKIEQLRKTYSNQMFFYAYLVNRYFKTDNIESVLVFLEKPGDIIIERYNGAKLKAFEKILKKSFEGIRKIEDNIEKPKKKLTSCYLCDYFNDNSCVY